MYYSKDIKIIGYLENKQMGHRIYDKLSCFPTILANIGGYKYMVIDYV